MRSAVNGAVLTLRPLTRADPPAVVPWSEDPDTRRFLGEPDWPAQMLAHAERSTGTVFRGTVQAGAHRYLALAGGAPVGSVDCGTFDCCTVFGDERSGGPIITETLLAATGSIAFVIDPALRGRGLGREVIATLFEAGVEPRNIASRRCLRAAGFQPASVEPDFEGMLHSCGWSRDRSASSGAQR